MVEVGSVQNASKHALVVSSLLGGCFIDKVWDSAVDEIRLRVLEHVSDVESPMRVDALFVIPSEVFQPDFEGFNRQRYQPADNVLRIEIALSDPPQSDPYAEVHSLLGGAIHIAEEYARKKKISTDLRGIWELHERISPLAGSGNS